MVSADVLIEQAVESAALAAIAVMRRCRAVVLTCEVMIFLPCLVLDPIIAGFPFGRLDLVPSVVPAEEPGPIRRSLSRGHGVWVPAFAGTTAWRVVRTSQGRDAASSARLARLAG